MKKDSHLVKHTASILLILLGLSLFGFCIIKPNIEQLYWSHTLSEVLGNARSVTLVERVPFYLGATAVQDVVLQQVDATQEQIKDLREAASGLVWFRLRKRNVSCFEPHHRVEIVCQDGSTSRLDICFNCSNFRLNEASRQPIPSSWLPHLGKFFAGLGMPPRTNEEYQALASQKVEPVH